MQFYVKKGKPETINIKIARKTFTDDEVNIKSTKLNITPSCISMSEAAHALQVRVLATKCYR